MRLATILVLGAAALHASWNLLIKTSDDRDLAALGQFAAGGLVFLPVLVVIGFPEPGAWPYLAASSIIHVAYVAALTAAYRHGDFSLAYPLARGTGAAVAAVGGAWVLGDALPAPAWLALVLVGAGLVSFAGRAVHRRALGWAVATGAVIGTYTLVDTVGARRSGGFSYGIALTLGAAVALGISALLRGRGPAFARSLRGSWPRYLVAGGCLTAAYSLVLVAVRHAPVGYVATLRESAVVLGALAGWVVLREPLGPRRLASSGVVAAGLVALVALR